MKIVCYTTDTAITERLREVFGIKNVEVGQDFARLLDFDRNGWVTVVDLKSYKFDELESVSQSLIVLTEIPSFQEAFQLLQKGIRGYGNRIMRLENLEQAVKSVADGQIWLPPEIIIRLIETVGSGAFSLGHPAESTGASELMEQLSKREQEVALCVAEGMSNKEISEKLFVSLRTVKAHLSSIYDKTGMRNRLELGVKLKNRTV